MRCSREDAKRSSRRAGVAERDACALWVGGDAALVGMNLLPTEVGEGARARVAVAHVRAERGRRAERLACAFRVGADALAASMVRNGMNVTPEARVTQSIDMRARVTIRNQDVVGFDPARPASNVTNLRKALS